MKATNGLYRDYGVYICHIALGTTTLTLAVMASHHLLAGADFLLGRRNFRTLAISSQGKAWSWGCLTCEVEREQSLGEAKQTSNANISLNLARRDCYTNVLLDKH